MLTGSPVYLACLLNFLPFSQSPSPWPCVYVCMVDVGGCLHTCTHVSDVHDKYLPLSLAPYFLGQGLSMKLELTGLTTPWPSQCVPGIFLSPHPWHQDHRHTHHTQLLCGFLTPSLRSLCFCDKDFTSCAISAQSVPFFPFFL